MKDEPPSPSALEWLLAAADALVEAGGEGGAALVEAEMELLAAAREVGRIHKEE